MKVKIGKSYLTEIPHEGGKLIFQHPAFKGTYRSIAEQLDKNNLKRPNSPETVSLIYDAFQNPRGEFESQIIKILNDAWFLEFTGNLYLPKSNDEVNNGIILEYNPRIENGRLVMNKKSLIKRLQENDPDVKFVPFGFGFKRGEQNLIEFQRNPYIKARYGEEGAEKLTKIALEYKGNAYVWSPDFVNEEKIRISALGRDFANRLSVVGGNCRSHHLCGLAFGVCNSKKGK